MISPESVGPYFYISKCLLLCWKYFPSEILSCSRLILVCCYNVFDHERSFVSVNSDESPPPPGMSSHTLIWTFLLFTFRFRLIHLSANRIFNNLLHKINYFTAFRFSWAISLLNQFLVTPQFLKFTNIHNCIWLEISPIFNKLTDVCFR